MEYLSIGQIVKTIGLKGEVKVYPSTHFRDSRFKKGSHVFIVDENNNVDLTLTIKSHSKNGNCDNIYFEEISSIEEAEKLLHKELLVKKDYSFLKNGQYYYSDLIGCQTKFDNEIIIGKVIKVEEYNSYATLRIKTDKKDVLIPFVKSFIKKVDIENELIIINYIEGLL